MLPTTIWLIVTYSCNDRCRGCYAASCLPGARAQLRRQMPVEYAMQVMGELRRCGTENCLLIGGEPTLYADLPDLIEAGSALGLKMKLVSNGRRLADRDYLETLIRAGLVHASISIEAASPERHAAITASDGFEERLQGIRNVVAAGLSHNTILTISSDNVDQIVPVAEMVHTLGVRNVLYNFCLPAVDGRGGIDGSASLDPQACADHITAAYVELKRRGIPFTFFATIPLCLIPEEARLAMVEDRTIARSYHCHIFFGTGAAFEPDGSVLPCTHFAGTPLFNAMALDGSFTHQGRFAEAWETGVHADFVQSAWRYPAEQCQTCALWGVCVGGCPFQWMHFDPGQFLGERRSSDGGLGTPAAAAQHADTDAAAAPDDSRRIRVAG